MTINKEKKGTRWRDIHDEMYANDSEYREGFDALEPEFAVYEALIEMRRDKKMTQKQLAEKMGTHQSSIARFEAGEYNPSFDFVNNLVRALGLKIQIVKQAK